MSTPTFAKTPNLIAFLEKPSKGDGFEQIVDFLNANKIKKKVVVTEASIRHDLKLNDAEEDPVPTTSNDPLPTSEDSMKLKELMILCTNLSNKVLDLENKVIEMKSSHQEKIAVLESKEKSSKQERKITDIDGDAEKLLKKWLSVALTNITTGQPSEAKKINVDITTAPKAKGIVFYDMEELTTRIASSKIQVKDKGKAKLVEEHEVLKSRKAQIAIDKEVARMIEAEWNADMQDNIDWNEVIEHVQSRQLDDVRKYQALKRKPVEDLEVLWKIVKDMFKESQPKEVLDIFLWHTLKMFNEVRLQVDYEVEMVYDLLRLVRKKLKEDETVYKELEDRMERAAITTFSLEAEQDSDKQVEGMAKHKEIYVMSSHTKKIFANMKRQGHGFSRNITPLFETMMVTAQEEVGEAKEIDKLKKRVKKLEKRRKSRPAGLRRLKKFGSSKQVESSEEKDSLGAQEDASKQGRSIEDIDQDAEIALVDEAQGRMHDADMFGVDDLEGNEVFVDVREQIVEKEVSIVDQVTTAGEVVTVASVEDSAAPTTATNADVDDELTLAKTLIVIKAAKTKDKGKAKMIEPRKPLKKKDQITLDEEVASKFEAEKRAKMEEEERIARAKDEANRAVIEE
nr:hypothetical protein [Tanacetum cinerariifolium]